MSTFAVTVERLAILPHPNADALELAVVGLYRSVVAKGLYQTGDMAVFIPEQAILPDNLIAELGLTGKLAGSAKNRVKAVRLRGELSQGIVARPEALNKHFDYAEALESRIDLAPLLGVVKWVPEVPAHMDGHAIWSTDLMPWVDIENIKRYPDIFTDGEIVTATEKVHGSCTLFTYAVASGDLLVSSKGLGSKHLVILEAESNLYWRAVRAYDLPAFAAQVARSIDAADNGITSPVAFVGIFGEVYGSGVQDLTYGATAGTGKPGYAVFDVSVRYEDGTRQWLDQDEVRALTASEGVPMVPELYRGPYDAEVIAAIAEGKETISGQETNIREGVVVRPLHERRSDVLGGRAIGKWVSAAYLVRKGGTEFE